MSVGAKQGFTAVEILVTLFIGSLLLLGGYQAFSLVVENTKDTRERSIVSNYGYDAMRRFESQYTATPCQARTEANFPSGIIPANTSVKITSSRFSISCPYGTSSNISKVMTKITYGDNAKELIHATYAR